MNTDLDVGFGYRLITKRQLVTITFSSPTRTATVSSAGWQILSSRPTTLSSTWNLTWQASNSMCRMWNLCLTYLFLDTWDNFCFGTKAILDILNLTIITLAINFIQSYSKKHESLIFLQFFYLLTKTKI